MGYLFKRVFIPEFFTMHPKIFGPLELKSPQDLLSTQNPKLS